MSWTLPSVGLNALLAGLQEAQLALRAVLHALGLAPDLHGQPAWPFAQRVASEMLVFDAGHARRVVLALAAAALTGVALLLSILWRRGRYWMWAGALALVVLTPWPEAHLLFAPTTPTAFHGATSGFTAEGIERGRAVYAQHCLRCHGTDGRGEGPDAARLPMWPPTLNGSLLWKRLDGELFWHVRQGMQGRDGRETMPAFGAQLADGQVWEVLDFLQAQAAGQMLAREGAWAFPVRLPDATVQCRAGPPRRLRHLHGQRLRVVAAGPGVPLPADDPRLVTVALALPGVAPAGEPECLVRDAEAASALALVLGVTGNRLAGHQVMVDRDGWLRVRGRPGQAAWSEDDLVCRAAGAPKSPAQATASPGGADGLENLIRRMDAEPVRLLRGGFPH